MIPENELEEDNVVRPKDVKDAIRLYQEFARKKPLAYASQCLGVKPWSKQKAILKAAADPSIPLISVRSGNGVGKTYLAGTLICQYLDTHSPGYAVVTGASWQGVLKTVWPTFRRMHRNAPVNLGGDILGTEWRRGEMWGAFCVSPDTPENISGYRTENGALVIVDEASSLLPEVYDAILGVCSAAGSKIILLGNPLRPEGPFYDSFHTHGWVNFHISSIEASIQGIPGLASPEWIEARRKEWGEDSPMWKARVLGDFPEDTEDVLIPLSAVTDRTIENVLTRRGAILMGVDVARFGNDKTVIVVRDSRCVLDIRSYSKKSNMEVAGWVQQAMDDHGCAPENVMIDDTGLGGGVVDRLHELSIPVVPVDFGSNAYEEEKFKNTRTELYWNMRKALLPDAEEPLWLPSKFSLLIKELPWAKYKMESDQRIALEPKDKIKKRWGHSPDHADALALTFSPYGNYDFC
jgi:phage terminase large subunit